MTNFQLLLLLEKFIVNIGETSLQNRQFDITCFSICPRFRNNCFVFCTERNWKVREKYVKSKKKKKFQDLNQRKEKHWMVTEWQISHCHKNKYCKYCISTYLSVFNLCVVRLIWNWRFWLQLTKWGFICVTSFFSYFKDIKKIQDDLTEQILIFPLFKSQA